jgi:hypothetical protein
MSILQSIEFTAAFFAIVICIGVPFGLGLFLLMLGAYASVEEWWLRRRAIKSMQAEAAIRALGATKEGQQP